MARAGQVDAGLFSLVDVWDLEAKGLFEAIGSFGIAGKGAIGSILLFGVKEPQELEGQAIGVTGQTATTARLLELWLRQKVGLKSFRLVPLDQPAAASLLIGDQALTRRLSLSAREPRPIDLCEEWSRWTSTSFVFARWAVRKSLAPGEKAGLVSAIQASLDRSLSATGMRELCAHLARQTGFPANFLNDYLRGIRYFLGDEETAGMKLFRGKLGDKTPK
jgi:predicted solute-binding protein